jgi:hypothetical protein
MAVTYLPNVKQGNNVTIDCLHQALAHQLKQEGWIPSTLYVQLDNTTRQCKSRYLLGFCAYLVHLGVVKDVVVSFLPVGHTHEDIDQLFSRISVYLQQHDARSRLALEEAVHAAYHAAIHRSVGLKDQAHRVAAVLHRDRASNLSDFLDPHIAKLTNVGSQNDLFTHRQQFHLFRRPCRSTTDQDLRDKVGFEVHVETRTNAMGDWAKADFSGMGLNEASTPMFNYDDEDTIEFLLRDDPFLDVPAAQPVMKASHINDEAKRLKDRAKLDKMVRLTIENRGGFSARDIEDLDECLELLGSDAPLLFDWDTTLYTAAMANRQGFDDLHLTAQERNFQDKIKQGYKVNTFALFKAPIDDDAGVYLGKIMELVPERNSVMVKYCEAHKDTLSKEAKQRKYVFRMPGKGKSQRSTWDEADIDSLQMHGVELKKNNARVLEFSTAGAKPVQYWIEMMKKTREKVMLEAAAAKAGDRYEDDEEEDDLGGSEGEQDDEDE